PQAVNNSIPVILCDEEDVSGEHGATIGRLGDDVLFYMQSRGIPKESAENIIARAKVQALLGKITDDVTVSAVSDFMNGLFGED
ncbi:MAG: SufD family Fe-S cluster assembly protein, partial [Treponema porcinum]|nr:SufD family Fe-S cluster assembly protein [Treponema porcinum]